MRAHLLLPAMGKHPASAWSAGAQPAPTHDQSGLQPFPALCPGALRCRTTRLYYTCSVSTRRGAHDRPSPSFPCTCKHGSGKRQGKVYVEVATRRIRQLSCCQDVIVPLSEEPDLARYASCCPRCFCP